MCTNMADINPVTSDENDLLRDVHSHVYLQEESLSWFLSAVELSVYQLKIKDDQEKIGAIF